MLLFQSLLTFVIRMKGRFYQYLYSLLFALLTVLGLYYGQIQQYISTSTSSNFQFTTDIGQKENMLDSFAFLKDHHTNYSYNLSRPRYTKIRALSENDNENDENVEASASSEIAIVFKGDFWRLISGFVTIFHDKQNAVSFAHSEHLILPYDDLYIQYRVIRL